MTANVPAIILGIKNLPAERRTAKLRANDNAISAWAIILVLVIGNFTFKLIVHIKWMITRLTVP